jgi:glycosyltransferase involved in cell wall biosynthesis
VIHVVHVIGSLERGGAESILEAVACTASQHTRQTIICLSVGVDQESRIRHIEKNGTKVLQFAFRRLDKKRKLTQEWWETFSAIAKIIFAIKHIRPDVIQTWMYHSDLLGGLIGRILRIPVVWGIFLSNLDSRYYKKKTNRIISITGRVSRLLPYRIVSCTATGALSHQAIGYPSTNITTIPVGIDTEIFNFSRVRRNFLRSVEGCTADTIVIGMVARWDPQKNFELLFKAMEKAVRKNNNIRLWLAGGYGISEENSELVGLQEEFNLGGYVSYMGAVEDLVPFYSAIDIFSLISHGEGWPLVLAEAMSCCCPCVSSDVGDVRLLFGADGGLLLKSETSEELRHAWEGLILSGAGTRHSIGLRARQRILQKYQVANMVKDYEDLYSDVTQQHEKTSEL